MIIVWVHRKIKENIMKITSGYNIKDYEDALEGAGPKLKELILERAAQDHSIDFVELKRLVDRAYPEQA